MYSHVRAMGVKRRPQWRNYSAVLLKFRDLAGPGVGVKRGKSLSSNSELVSRSGRDPGGVSHPNCIRTPYISSQLSPRAKDPRNVVPVANQQQDLQAGWQWLHMICSPFRNQSSKGVRSRVRQGTGNSRKGQKEEFGRVSLGLLQLIIAVVERRARDGSCGSRSGQSQRVGAMTHS